MSTRADRRRPARALGRALVVSACALAPLAGASADEPTKGSSQDPSKLIPFDKPPQQVEAFDKCRIVVNGTKTAKTGQLAIEVKGAAYYPDDTKYFITVRHSKVETVFSRVTTTVQKHAFTVTLGPFPKTVPGGELVVDAWFDFIAQTGPVKAAIWKGDETSHGSYFHCPNGCKYDRKNLAMAKCDNGGPTAQAKDEELEKEQIGKARTALLDARRAFKVAPSAASLKQLEQDTQAAMETFERWNVTRQFLFFRARADTLTNLRDAINREGKVLLAGDSGGAAQVAKEIEEKSDGLKGFLEEKDSLNKYWEEYEKTHKGDAVKDASHRPGEADAGDGAPPPGPPGGGKPPGSPGSPGH